MNNYEFDYMNYIMNIPPNINNQNQVNNNYNTNTPINASNLDITNPYIGFIRGNIFDNLYNQYKQYKPNEINASNEKEALLYQIMQYKFNLTDLNLYLDTNPNDITAIDLYNKYLTMEKDTCNKYESMYGPLTLDTMYQNTNSWAWDNSPWPWEVK